MGSIKDSLGSWSFLFGPVTALAVLLLIIVLMRWTFGRGRSRTRPRDREEYLVEAARLSNVIEAEYLRCVLGNAGVDTALTQAQGHQLLLVPENQLDVARALIRHHAPG